MGVTEDVYLFRFILSLTKDFMTHQCLLKTMLSKHFVHVGTKVMSH